MLVLDKKKPEDHFSCDSTDKIHICLLSFIFLLYEPLLFMIFILGKTLVFECHIKNSYVSTVEIENETYLYCFYFAVGLTKASNLHFYMENENNFCSLEKAERMQFPLLVRMGLPRNRYILRWGEQKKGL